MKKNTASRSLASISHLVAALTLATCAFAGEPGKVGPEFEINTQTTGEQRIPTAALGPDGQFIIAWHSESSAGSDSDGYSIQLRAFDSTGAPITNDLQVNTASLGNQDNAAIADRQDGAFVLVWKSLSSSGDDSDQGSIQLRRFDSAGSALGGEIQVNVLTSGSQQTPSLARSTDGTFLVVWASNALGQGINGRRLDVAGLPVGDEMTVSSHTTGFQHRPDVAALLNDDFMVVWDGATSGDESSYGVAGRIVDKAAGPIGGDLQINTFTTGIQRDATLIADARGRFTVVWENFEAVGDDTNFNVRARYFDSTGQAADDDFQIESTTTADIFRPRVHGTPKGDVFVVWESSSSPGDDNSSLSLLGRYFVPGGSGIRPTSDDFQINTFTESLQANADIVTGGGDTALVVWNTFASDDLDQDGTSIRGQHFELPLVFADGFESGDFSFWSSTTP